MADKPLSLKAVKVLMVFANDSGKDLYGGEIMDIANISSGTLYPILINFEKRGWLESDWENIDPEVAGRRPRRYYKLTEEGANAARREREEVVKPLARLAGVLEQLAW